MKKAGMKERMKHGRTKERMKKERKERAVSMTDGAPFSALQPSS
jgi:hypothetical protein